MAQQRNRARNPRIGSLKWIVFSVAIALAALASSQTPAAQSSRSANQTATDPRAMSGGGAAQIEPAVNEDPAVSFERSRRSRRRTILAPRSVVEAHRRWLAQGRAVPASPGPATSAVLAPAIGANVDLPVNAYQGETAIAINPANAQQLVGAANSLFADPNCPVPSGTNDGTQALYGSTDGGNTWVANCAPWPSSLSGGTQNTSFASDPAVAWDSAGHAYAAYLLVNINCSGGTCNDLTASDAIEVVKSSDSGNTWTSLGQVVNNLGNSAVFDDKELIAIDTTSGALSHPGRIFVIWDHGSATGQPEQVAFSDNGTAWTTTAIDTATAVDSGGDIAIGPDGVVYAVWNQIGTNSETTMFSQSVDGGSAWTPPSSVVSHILLSFGANDLIPAQNQRGINAFPALAVDRSASGNSGNIYLVYSDYPSAAAAAGATDTNIYFIRSTNKGLSWSTPIQVNNDTGGASQFFPWVDVDQSSGAVAVSWYDTRNDPLDRQTQIFTSQSLDGGASFPGNFQVSSPSLEFANSGINYSDENSSDNPNANSNQYGDYAQIAFLNGIAHPMWCDSRNFFPANTSNVPAEDAASAQVNFTASVTPTPSPTPTPVSATLSVRPAKTANFPPQVTLGGQGGQNQKPVLAVIGDPKTAKQDVPIQITNVQITGNGFSFFPDSPITHCIGTLNPGKTCAIQMAFSPTQPGVSTGSLIIDDNTTAGQHTIELRGTGKTGKLTYTPKALSFSAAVGSTSAPKSVSLRNRNPVPLEVGNPSPTNPAFLVGGSCLGQIPANGSCTLKINFKPSQRGTTKGQVIIQDDAAGAPHEVNLTGTGK